MFFNARDRKTNAKHFKSNYAQLCGGTFSESIIYKLEKNEFIHRFSLLPVHLLVGVSFGSTRQAHNTYVWNAKTGELLSRKAEPKLVTNLIPVADSIIATVYFLDGIVFYDYTNPLKPQRLKEIPLSGSYEIIKSCFVYPHNLVLLLRRPATQNTDFVKSTYQLLRVDFDVKDMVEGSINTQLISNLPEDIGADITTDKALHAFTGDKVIIGGFKGIYIYSIHQASNEPWKKIIFPQRHDKPYFAPSPAIHITKKGQLITLSTRSNYDFVCFCWDFTQLPNKEITRELTLPRNKYTRGIYSITEDNQGHLIIIPDEIFGARIMIMDIKNCNFEQFIIQNETLKVNMHHCHFINNGTELIIYENELIKKFPVPQLMVEEETSCPLPAGFNVS